MSELLFIHVGQCGCQVGSRLWKLFGKEHGVNSDGYLALNSSSTTESNQPAASTLPSQLSNNISSLYTECWREENKLEARCLFIDSDPMVIEQLQNDSSIRKLLKDENLIKGQEDCASNFGRGKYSVGRSYLGYIRERIRKMLESSDSPAGFVLTNSIEAGTGSGFTSFISEILNDNFPKLVCFNRCADWITNSLQTSSAFSVFPSENFKTEVVESYNSVLALSDMTKNLTNIFDLENESMYKICKKYGVDTPDYRDVNDIISQTVSTFSHPVRVNNSYFPILTPNKSMNIISSTFTRVDNIDSEINTTDLLTGDSRMNNIDHLGGKTLSMNISLRGNFSQIHANTLTNQLRELNTPQLGDNSLQHGVFTKSTENISESSLSFSNYIHVSNNSTSIVGPLTNLTTRFLKLYRK